MSIELRVVQYFVRVPNEDSDGEQIKYSRYELQYRLEDWWRWKTVPTVLCEEGSKPSED